MQTSAIRTRAQRIEGIARLIPRLGQPANRADAAGRLCDAVRDLSGASAVALFLDDGVIVRAATSGFALEPPEGLPASLDDEELQALSRWGLRAGIGAAEVAPVRIEQHLFGALVLFGGAVEPLLPEDLALLGSVAAHVLEQARVLDELRRTYETHERTQDQVVRTERLRVLGEMAHGIAHDFNNVLNAVLGQVGVLELLSAGRSDLAAPIERLKRISLEGAQTVGRLQDFSRQRRDQEFAELDLSHLARAAATWICERSPSPVQVEQRIDPGVLVAGNAGELREVLEAAIENALEAKSHCIVVRVERLGDEARVVVSDDGSGMSRDVRKRAFDPFFTTKGSLASGLGLSVAYGIIRRHGGRIELDSTPGHGTKVRIRLPALRRAHQEEKRVDPPAPTVEGGARILLVEDDDDNREAMATLLGLGGHKVVAEASGGDGVRRFACDTFDLVLTDLGLPDMTGWEVARQVKDVSSTTPVALITGWGLNLAQEEIERRGVDLLIKKPIEPRKFLEQLAGLGLRDSDAKR